MDTENIDLIVGSLFILFIIAGMVVTTIVSIIMRKREFGIKMVLGESKFGMLIQIVLENICIAIVGMFFIDSLLFMEIRESSTSFEGL